MADMIITNTVDTRSSLQNGPATYFAVYDPITAGMVSDLGARKVTEQDVGLNSHEAPHPPPGHAEILDSLKQQQNIHHDAVGEVLKNHTDEVSRLINTILDKLSTQYHPSLATFSNGHSDNRSGSANSPRSERRFTARHSPSVQNLAEYRKNSCRKGLLEAIQKKDMNGTISEEELEQTNGDSAPGANGDSSPSKKTKRGRTRGTSMASIFPEMKQSDRPSPQIWEQISSAMGLTPSWPDHQQHIRQARTGPIDIREIRAMNRWSKRCRNAVQAVVQQRNFEIAASGLIMANAIVIGIQADDAMKRLDNSTVPIVFPILNLFFTTAFTIELVLRIIAEGIQFLSCNNLSLRWNVFDTVLVICSLVDLLLSSVINEKEDDKNSEVSSIRMLRLLRLIRIMRLVRVMRFFQDLRNMVTGIISSLKSLMWALLLLNLIMYSIAVSLLQIIAGELEGTKTLSQQDLDSVKQNFGRLLRAVYTLYQAICGGIDWGDAVEPLMEIHWLLVPLFAMYIAFAVFCVLNIVTGVFVESANKLTKADEDTQNMEELDRRQRWLHKVREAFISMDRDKSGEISLPNLELYLTDIKGQLVIQRLGLDLDLTNAKEFFRLLDHNGNGMLTADEFIAGCKEMRGSAKGFEIARMNYDILKMRSELLELHEVCEHIQEILARACPSSLSSRGCFSECADL